MQPSALRIRRAVALLALIAHSPMRADRHATATSAQSAQPALSAGRVPAALFAWRCFPCRQFKIPPYSLHPVCGLPRWQVKVPVLSASMCGEHVCMGMRTYEYCLCHLCRASYFHVWLIDHAWHEYRATYACAWHARLTSCPCCPCCRRSQIRTTHTEHFMCVMRAAHVAHGMHVTTDRYTLIEKVYYL